MKERDKLTEKIIKCCYDVHNELGPGFNEKIYHNALKKQLRNNNITFETEKKFEVLYKETPVGELRVD